LFINALIISINFLSHCLSANHVGLFSGHTATCTSCKWALWTSYLFAFSTFFCSISIMVITTIWAHFNFIHFFI